MEDQTATIEFSKFQKILYLDYNVFNYFSAFSHDTSQKEHQSAVSLFTILQSLYDKSAVCIPYSYAHIADIIQGNKYFDSKHKTIEGLTNGWYVSEDTKNNQYIRVDKCLDVCEHFEDTKRSIEFAKTMQLQFAPLISLAFNAMMKKYDDNHSGDATYTIVNNFLKKSKIETIDDLFVLNYKISNYFNANRKIVDILEVSNNDILRVIDNEIRNSYISSMLNMKTLSEYENWSLNLFKNQFNSTFFQKILSYGLLSDIIGLTHEKNKKIERETFTSSMTNDLLHLAFGIRAHIFVTNDKNLLKKAVFCKKLLNLSTKIFLQDDFIKQMINDYIRIKQLDKNGSEFKVVARQEDNTLFEYKYIVDLSKVYNY